MERRAREIHPGIHPGVDDRSSRSRDTDGMSLSDYVIDIGLIALVLLQVRGRRLTTRAFLLPLVLVAWAAASYLHGIPTAGNDLPFVALATALGAALGVGAGLTTAVRRGADGTAVAKAGAIAAALWVVGVGTRLAFQLYATHGGGQAIGRFSVAHHITSSEAWVAALILMAFGEVAGRSAVLLVRTLRLAPARPVAVEAALQHHGSR